jgi:phage gpG-like protein
MINEIRIEGIEEAITCFDKLEQELLNPQEPLEKSAGFMREEALRNFPTQGGAFEEPWSPLRETTLKIKEKKGYGGQPMMVRTGLLRDSFMDNGPMVSSGMGEVEVYNPVSYAKEHQYGIPGKLPRRVLLKFIGKQVNDITNIFFDWVVQKIEKSFNN